MSQGAAHHARVRDLFIQVVELEQEVRRRFLDATCAEDPGLRAELESLLAHHRRSDLRDPARDG